MGRKLMFLSGGFASAVFAAQFLVGNNTAVAVFVLAVIAAVAVLCIKEYKLSALLLTAGVLFGAFWNHTYIKQDVKVPESITNIGMQAELRVTDYSEKTRSGTSVSFSAEIYSILDVTLEKPIRAEVYTTNEYMRVKPGDVIKGEVQIEIPEDTESFAAYTYYKTRKVDVMAYLSEDAQITRCEHVPLRYLHKTVRNAVIKRVNQLLPEDEAAFLNALIIGDKSRLSEAVKEEMRITGLSHTIAVSGMHISFLVGIIVLLVGKKHAPIFAVPIMLMFALTAGSTPSVVRAVIMQCFVLAAPFVMREADSITSLFAALLVILLMNPYAIGDVGLQLSFAATLGLVLFSGKISYSIVRKFRVKTWKWRGRIIRFFATTFSATVSAMAFTVPIVIWYFDTISLISLPANIMVIWAISLLFSLGVAVVVLSFVWQWLAGVFASVLGILIRGISSEVHMLADIPYASVYAMNGWALSGLLLLYTGVVFGYIGHKAEMRIQRCVTPVCMACFFAFLFIGAYTPATQEMNFTVFDVGQGLCVMAEHRDYNIVIDCGGESGYDAANAAYGALIKKNTRYLDALILTHAHDDHINGAEVLINKGKVKSLYIPAQTAGTKEMEAVIKVAHSRGTKVYAVDSDRELNFGDMRVVLNVGDFTEKKDDIGITAMICKGDFEVLVTGDLSGEIETAMALDGRFADTEVYVVGHHGSKSSSSDIFLDRICPEYAIISVGENNSHGHPHAETLNKFRERGINVICTDEIGTVKLNSAEIVAGWPRLGRANL